MLYSHKNISTGKVGKHLKNVNILSVSDEMCFMYEYWAIFYFTLKSLFICQLSKLFSFAIKLPTHTEKITAEKCKHGTIRLILQEVHRKLHIFPHFVVFQHCQQEGMDPDLASWGLLVKVCVFLHPCSTLCTNKSGG